MKKNEASHQVGHFTIGRRIHSTSEKSVYFASNPNGTRNLSDAAVYQLHPNHRLEQNSIDLTADAEILRQLNHSSFPKILHSYELEHAFARE